MSGFNVSIIVPVLNEAPQLTALMNQLRLLKDEWVKEIIIVDGGSTFWLKNLQLSKVKKAVPNK